MNKTLTDGYTVVRGVLDATDLDGVRDAITETIDHTARALHTPFEESAPHLALEMRLEEVARRDRAYASALFHAVMADVHRDSRVSRLVAHEGLTDVVRQLLAPMVIVGHVVRPRAVIPTFSSARSPWHQDVVRPTSTPGSCGSVQLACWIPLADVDDDTGALEVIPGNWDAPLPHDVSESGHFFVSDTHLPTAPRHKVPLKSGDVLVLDRFIPHRSLPVREGHGRWALVMWVKACSPGHDAP